jgi:hypothetical protein
MRIFWLRAVTVGCAAAAVTAAVTSAGATPALASTGSGPLTADQVAAKAAADMRSASSVRVSSSGRVTGQSFASNMILTREGCLGSFSLGSGRSMTELQIGNRSWIKPDDAMWKAFGYTGSQLASVEGKWLGGSAVSAVEGAAGNECALHGFTTGLPATGWTEVRPLSVRGKRALELFNDAKDKQDRGYMDVSVSAKPEILEISTNGVTAYFSDYNAKETLTPPPASDVITKLPPPSGS